MATVSQYWPSSYWQSMNQSLAWLYGRQSGPAGNWLANAMFSVGATSTFETEEPSSGLVECGISSLSNFLTGLTVSGAQEAPLAMSQIESIVATLPAGLSPDNQLGPDGYPVNESGVALAWGTLLVNGYEVTASMQQSINTLLYNANATQITPGPPQTPGVIAKWSANTYHPFGALIVDSNNNTQMALYNGVTANTGRAPNWLNSLGALSGDNTQVWKAVAAGYQNIGWVATGYVFNLLRSLGSYRVDVFVHADIWYYQASSGLQSTAPGGNATPNAGTWSVAGVHPGLLLAALYPTSVSAPASGWSGSAIPAGWVAHTNTGVCQTPGINQLGGRLGNYKAQVYVQTDIEYLQEDNIPILVQSDGFHARAGSSVMPGAGTPTVHILYNDPVAGWTEVYDSLQSELVYQDLPRSYDVPTSDPLFVPNPGATDIPAIQNRSFIYDCALAIMAYSAAGNFTAAEKIVKQLNAFLATPCYLASLMLENAEDGSTARWSASGSGATIANVAASSTSPPEPPYGTGAVLDFHSGSAIATFTYAGIGFPDANDTQLSFEHMEGPAASFVFTIGVTTAKKLVTAVQATNATAGPATLAGTVITLPIGPGGNGWRTTLLDLASLISSLTSDALASITGFQITLTAVTSDLYFDNFSVGGLQPANSLSFSYDTYNGQVDQAYIRAGSMAWVIYAYCIYMAAAQDFSSLFELQGMINFLLTLQSSAGDLTQGLFYEGYGRYVNPGYQFVPGKILTVATEHQVDLYFAFMRAASVLTTGSTYLLKTAQITAVQAASFTATASTVTSAASTIWTQLAANVYIPPAAPTLLSGCLAYWKFDEDSGTTVGDASGHGFIGTDSASGMWTTGKIGSAGSAKGGPGGEQVSVTQALGTLNDFSVGGWFKATSGTDQGTLFQTASNSDNSYIYLGYGAGESYTAHCLGFNWSTATGVSGQILGSIPIEDGNWHHTFAIRSGATVSLYVDGVLDASVKYTDTSAILIAGAASQTALMGDPDNVDFGDSSLTGALDEWGVWTRALSLGELATLYNSGAGLQYPFAVTPVPGRFAQGVTGSTLDTSEALDASGHWAALCAHANGRDDIALQCAEFAYENFLVTNQTIATSNATDSYNEAYSLATPIGGMKPYNDSPGGYSGSPLSVWQEGTWGMILMLLTLYSIPGITDFFAGIGTTIDSVLAALVGGQFTILQVTGNGSLLAYSLAARGLPYEFDVWPGLAPTAWMWLVSTNPSLVLSVSGQPQMLPYMYVPSGAEQSIDDKNGSSSVGQMEIHCIDPGGVLHTLAAQQELIGQIATFSMGFPGGALGDFVPLHVLQISEIGFDADGRVILKATDLKRFVQGSFLWANGGPEEWLPGQKNLWQPSGAQWLANGFPTSNENPRWLSGNPLDIFLAAMQNELGVGQDQALSAVVEEAGTGELFATVNPFWAKYVPAATLATQGNQATLINPNPYLDVPGIVALRDGMFSGDWFEFKITSPQQARSWLEDQILKPLGLVVVVTSTGQLTLKPMKNPANQTPVYAFTQRNIVGIPQVSLAPIINALAYRLDVDDSTSNSSARTYNSTVTMLQQDSYNLFRYLYNHQVEATGLRTGRGGSLRAFLLGDQLFRRYGFATPVYQTITHLAALQPELKDWVSFTHPQVPDYLGGGRGVVNVPCEVIGRSPDYANARMRFTLLDMRRSSTTVAYEVAPLADGIPAYAQTTGSQQQTYFFISPSANGMVTEELSTIF